jgi:hypothetical protein
VSKDASEEERVTAAVPLLQVRYTLGKQDARALPPHFSNNRINKLPARLTIAIATNPYRATQINVSGPDVCNGPCGCLRACDRLAYHADGHVLCLCTIMVLSIMGGSECGVSRGQGFWWRFGSCFWKGASGLLLGNSEVGRGDVRGLGDCMFGENMFLRSVVGAGLRSDNICTHLAIQTCDSA